MNGDTRDLRVSSFYMILFLFLFFSGCSRKKKIQMINSDEKDFMVNAIRLDRIMQVEAMLVNIPLPLYDERIILDENDVIDNASVVVLGYKSSLSKDQAIDFFMNQMERYGWKYIVSFVGKETILQFKNPDSYCTIVIKVLSEDTSSIFIYTKRASNKMLAHQ